MENRFGYGGLALDFSQALTFQFKDPRWGRKLLLAALISLIPLIGQAVVLGWSLAITRQVIEAETGSLPEMDFANDFLRGIKAWGLGLIYLVPALLLAAPLGLGLGITLAAGDGRAATFWLLTGLCLLAGFLIYGLGFAFILPAIYG